MLYGVPISWRSLQRNETQLENTAAITVTAGTTIIFQLGALAVVVGDRIRVRFIVRGTKGITAGDVSITLERVAGAGIIQWIVDAFPPRWRQNAVPASAVWEISGEVSGIVTASGTVDFRMHGTSPGSNSTIAIDEAKLGIEMMFG